MPPHEAYRANLSPRNLDSCPANLPYLIALGVAGILFTTGFYLAELYRRRLVEACSTNQEILNSLSLTKQALAEAVEAGKEQHRELLRLHRIGTRYVLMYGPLQPADLEQIAAEAERASWERERGPEDNTTPGSRLHENEDVFVVGGDEDAEDETPIRDSVLTNASAIEMDPVAPRIATTGVVRTAARLSGEAARPRRRDGCMSF